MRISSVFLASILLSCGLSVPLFAQSGYEVKGVVVDSEGPVIGATVMESGTQNGTSTYLDGDYVLQVSSADAIVEFSCIGYKTVSMPARSVPSTVTLEFDSEMTRTDESEMQIARFVAGFVEREGKLHFTAAAVGEVIEWAARLVEDKNKLSTQLNKIAEILVESTALAKAEGKRQVGIDHVRKALSEKIFRYDMWEEKVLDEYRNSVIRIDTDGFEVGQINGLTVSQLIDHSFGSPVRITANVFMGTEGVVNIEREVRMTGPIHNKGLMTLSSYLGRMYAKKYPLSISARIAFEQTYGGIEGALRRSSTACSRRYPRYR